MNYSGVVAFLVCLFFFVNSSGDGIDPNCQRSTEGTEFWFGFMEGRSSSKNHYTEITVTSRLDATFSVYIGGSQDPYDDRSFFVPANGSEQLRIPFELVEPTSSEELLPMGIRLVSDNPVNVYALNHDDNSSDVAVIYPVGSLGTEYLTMCYKPHLYTSDRSPIPDPEHGRNSEFVIVASEDSTTVRITPSEEPDGPNVKGKPITVIMNRGDLYQVQSLLGDLTGSIVSSDKPVAVFSGSFSTTIPFETPNGGWDHLYEQMPPVTAWGREYYTVPLSGRSKDYFRVMAMQDNTTFYINNTKYPVLQKAEFKEFAMNQPARIFADKPILVAQYSQSKSNDKVKNGDGFMVILNPVSQAKNDVTFVAYESTLMRVYYVNVVVPVSETGHMELSGDMISSSSFRTYPNGKYAYAQLPLSQGTWRLRNITPNKGFIAYVYGFGGNEAYGYGVGFNLNLVLNLSESLADHPNLSPQGDTLVICPGDQVLLDAGPYFDYYQWNDGSTESTLTVSTSGLYRVEAGTSDKVCTQTDEIEIIVDDPPPVNLGGEILGCPGSSVVLDAGGGYRSYEWTPGEATTQRIVADTTGVYEVRAYDHYGCPVTGSVYFKIHPVADFEVNYPVALLDHANLSFTNNSLWADSYRWNFGDGSFSNEEHPEHRYTSLGHYQAELIAYVDQCTDTFTMGIEILPFDVYAPNAFRPDSQVSDNNKTFFPVILGVDPAFVHLQVFNRWGEMVFESKNLDHPWTGKMKNGKDAPLGNYVWKMDYTDIQGFRHSRKGQVMLVR